MLSAAVVYGFALFVIAVATDFNGFLVGMAISGLGFGMYVAVDLALVADVLPDKDERRQGPRRVQHRGCAAVRPRPRDRSGHPGHWQLQHARRRRLDVRLRRRGRDRPGERYPASPYHAPLCRRLHHDARTRSARGSRRSRRCRRCRTPIRATGRSCSASSRSSSAGDSEKLARYVASIDHDVRRAMAVAAVKQLALQAATGAKAGERVRFNLVNGKLLQRIFFEGGGFRRKPVSMRTFKLLYPRLSQRALLMPLVARKGIYCFYSAAADRGSSQR